MRWFPARIILHHHPIIRTVLVSAWLVAVGAGANLACTGSISGNGSGSGAGGNRPGPQGTSTGTGGGTVVPPGVLDPGRVPMRRLNRAEYCNTVHDLLG